MFSATLAPPSAGARRDSSVAPVVLHAAVRLADAVAEYDAALDRGAPMLALVLLDQEVAAATRSHRAALAEVAGAGVATR